MAEKGQDRGKVYNFRLPKSRGTPSAECVRTLIVLKQQESIIEKSLNSLIASMKASSEISKDIQREQMKISSGRKKLFDSLKNTLYDIADELKFAKSTIQNISEIDVDKYRSKLDSLWKKMDEFNRSNILETLVKEQKPLDLELNDFNEQLHKYEKYRVEMNRPVYHAKSFKSNNDLYGDYDDMNNFESLVAKTGHTQRWSDEDHLLFLKLRKKCKTIPALVTALQSKCPDLSTETIINHESWYKMYLDLRQKQRDQINEWRRMKKNHRQRQIRRQMQENVSNDSDEASSSDTSKRQTEFADKNGDRAIRVEITKKSKIVDEFTSESKKQLIRQWKMERENQRLQEERDMQERMKTKQMEEERKRQERNYRMKIELMEYKQKKMKEAERILENQIEHFRGNNKRGGSMQMLRQRDQRFMQRRRQLIQQKNAINNQTVANRATNFKRRFPRNGGRQNFLRSTKGWEQKCTFFDPRQKQTPRLMYIKDLPPLRTFIRRNLETF